jgi:3-O-methylgallate 3,4-dioxygenase
LADIIGCLAMSHGPQLLTPSEKWPDLPDRVKPPFHPKPGIESEITLDAMRANQERCNAAISDLRDRLAAWQPDTVVIVGDDQHENILDDNMPPFTLFIGDEVDATIKYGYEGKKPTDQMTRYTVNRPLAEEALLGLMDRGFDPSWSRETRYEAGLGHAFGRVLNFLMPDGGARILPVMVNTYFPPTLSSKRGLEFGMAIGEVIAASQNAERVVVIGSGGLSHTKIDERLDQDFMAALASFDTGHLTAMTAEQLVHGTSEILNWIIVAGTARSGGTMVDYVPCYRNDNGVGCAMGFAYWEQPAA